MSIDSSLDRRTTVLRRILPLAGVLYGALAIGADLAVGPLPGGETPAAQLPQFYAAHAGSIALAGTLLDWSAVCLAVFGAAVWWQLRRQSVPPVIGVVVLLGAAVTTVVEAIGAGAYGLLADLAPNPALAAGAVQSWHLTVAELGVPAGPTLLLLGFAAAGVVRAVPVWLAVVSVLLLVAQHTPYAFAASLAFLAWAAVAGITLAVRPHRRPAPATAVPAAV